MGEWFEVGGCQQKIPSDTTPKHSFKHVFCVPVTFRRTSLEPWAYLREGHATGVYEPIGDTTLQENVWQERATEPSTCVTRLTPGGRWPSSVTCCRFASRKELLESFREAVLYVGFAQ